MIKKHSQACTVGGVLFLFYLKLMHIYLQLKKCKKGVEFFTLYAIIKVYFKI